MKWLTNLFKSKRSLENPNVPLNSPWFGPPTLAGVPVDPHNALHYSAFWCGVRAISADLASLKLQPYQQTSNGKKPAKQHLVTNYVHHTPNGIRPACQFWCSMFQHGISWGNGYAEIERNNRGEGFLHLYRLSE